MKFVLQLLLVRVSVLLKHPRFSQPQNCLALFVNSCRIPHISTNLTWCEVKIIQNTTSVPKKSLPQNTPQNTSKILANRMRIKYDILPIDWGEDDYTVWFWRWRGDRASERRGLQNHRSRGRYPGRAPIYKKK